VATGTRNLPAKCKFAAFLVRAQRALTMSSIYSLCNPTVVPMSAGGWQPARHRRSLGSDNRQRHRRRKSQHPLFHRRPGRRKPRLVRKFGGGPRNVDLGDVAARLRGPQLRWVSNIAQGSLDRRLIVTTSLRFVGVDRVQRHGRRGGRDAPALAMDRREARGKRMARHDAIGLA
jgi:hypothetical protein